jgi:Voltage gated chloride channel
VSLLTYFHPSFWFGNKMNMMDLFNRENLSSELASGMYHSDSPIFLLVSAIIIRFLVFWIMVTTPTPNGVFAPGVVIGGIIGRAFAEIGNSYFGLKLNRRVFATSGAAAFSGVITRTTSPILVLLEMTGEMDYLFGLIVTTLVANAVGSIYIVSFFDTVLNIRKLPYLPVLFSSAWYKRIAAEISEPCTMMIAKNSNLVDLLYMLKKLKLAQLEKKRGKLDTSALTRGTSTIPDDDPGLDVNREDYVAVVESLETPILVGSIKAGAMFDYIEMEIKDIETKLESGNIQGDVLIQRYFGNLKSENAQEKNTAGDSNVVKLGKDVMDYIHNLTPTEKTYNFTEDGQIYEEENLIDVTSSKNKRKKDARKLYLKTTIESIINEIKEEADMNRRAENRGRRLSRKSMKGNDDRYFQFFRQVMFRKEVRFDHPVLQYNSYPTNVRSDTRLIKIHYLFQMLGTSWIYVRGENEHLRGVITKQNFLSLRYKLSAGG